MKRHIIKQGTSTLTISLPSSWVKSLNLEGGDEVEVTEVNQNLIISTNQRIHLKRAILDISEFPEKIIRRYFTALYMSGYDEIVIRFSEPKQLKLLQEITDDHIGFTIIEQTSRHCVAKEIAKPQPDDFEKLMRRLFHMITTAGNDLLTAVEKNDYEMMLMIREADESVNKISGYCIRLLNKFGHPSKQNILSLDDLVRNLERLGDSYKHIAKAIINRKAKVSKETIKIIKETNIVMQEFFHLYFHFDKEKLVMAYERKNALVTSVEECLNAQKSADNLVLSEIKRAVIIFSEISQSIMALNIETEEEQKNKMPEKIMNREESREKKNKKEKSFIHS